MQKKEFPYWSKTMPTVLPFCLAIAGLASSDDHRTLRPLTLRRVET